MEVQRIVAAEEAEQTKRIEKIAKKHNYCMSIFEKKRAIFKVLHDEINKAPSLRRSLKSAAQIVKEMNEFFAQNDTICM